MSNKEAYEKKIEAQMEEWQAEIDKMKARSKEKSADAEIEYNKKIEDIEQRKAAAESKLDDIKKSSSDAWDELKSGMQDAADSLNDAIESAKKQFS